MNRWVSGTLFKRSILLFIFKRVCLDSKSFESKLWKSRKKNRRDEFHVQDPGRVWSELLESWKKSNCKKSFFDFCFSCDNRWQIDLSPPDPGGQCDFLLKERSRWLAVFIRLWIKARAIQAFCFECLKDSLIKSTSDFEVHRVEVT